MVYAVFLCNNEWKIERILQCEAELALHTGDCLCDRVSDPAMLPPQDQHQHAVMLHFTDSGLSLPAIFCTLSSGTLVFLARVESAEEFVNVAETFGNYLAWAEEQLPYDDSYYQLQQMNNQLINSQRALMRSNSQLKRALDEVRTAKDVITLLEQDALTGLYCATGFYQQVRRRLAAEPDTQFDFIALDLEHFTLANDIFSKKDCDSLLQQFALFLSGLDDTGDGIFARVVVDVFYILMPAERCFYDILRRELPRFFETAPLPVHLSERIGVYTDERNEEDITVEQRCSRARLALDTVKTHGSLRVAFYDRAMHEQLVMEHRILDSVQDALDDRQFQLYLQPKVRIETGEYIGAEALVRWIHPTLGFIPPDKFIPLLEKENRVYEVDQCVWEQACAFQRDRLARGNRPLPVSINLARSDLYQEDLFDVLEDLLQKYGLKPEYLRLEIIERDYTNDSSRLCEILTELRKRGFVIEMDDFGVGASSLSMAADMPVDVLKLDRSFLTADLTDPRHLALVRFIIDLAKTLQMTILAEGVETKEQADLLVSMGCHYAQGYLYSKPVPAAELLDR